MYLRAGVVGDELVQAGQRFLNQWRRMRLATKNKRPWYVVECGDRCGMQNVYLHNWKYIQSMASYIDQQGPSRNSNLHMRATRFTFAQRGLCAVHASHCAQVQQTLLGSLDTVQEQITPVSHDDRSDYDRSFVGLISHIRKKPQVGGGHTSLTFGNFLRASADSARKSACSPSRAFLSSGTAMTPVARDRSRLHKACQRTSTWQKPPT